ncbi:MAG TPA: hypothetical protein VJG48_00800 [Candidatus Paceibacterota bacterium]
MAGRKVLIDVVEQKVPEPTSTFLTKERRDERRANIQPPISFDPGLAGDESRKRLTWIIAISVGGLLVGGFILATILGRAVVTITPRTEAALVDSTFRVYPARETEGPHYDVVKVSDTESTNAPASGTKTIEKKATGTIILYNASSRQAVRIISNTRFQSPDGKIYRSHSVSNVPGYKVIDGKTVPGSVEVSVTADTAGSQYNIGPSDFKLPGLAGSPMADSVYGKSVTSMSGGFLGDVNIVSDADLAKARATLEGTMTEKLLAKIKAEVKDDKMFFNNYSTDLVFNEYGDTASSTGQKANVDDSKTQAVSLTGTAYAIVFDKRELSTYISRRVLSGAGDADLLIGNWDVLTAELNKSTDLGNAEDLSLHLAGNAEFIWQVNEEALKKDLVGIKKSDYTKVFLNYPSVNKAEVSISPFWSSSFPKNVARIIIKQVLP